MEKSVKKGDTVLVDYTGKLETGEVFDTSKGKQPIEFEVGSGKVIKGFDEGIIGMSVGEEKTISIPPENAYGQKNETYIKDIPRKTVPKEIDVEPGHLLIFKREDGLSMPATIISSNDDIVKVDFNHPLAGKTLKFEVKLIKIN